MPRSLPAWKTLTCFPMMRAAASTSLTSGSAFGLFGFDMTAITAAPGIKSWINPSRFSANADARKLTPVTLPPGRLRLATSPSLTGSPPA